MGKYMKKGKITGGVSVMEVPQSALGVRTRAKTLALQKNPELSYLQLRSRRLEKPQFPPPSPSEPERLEKQKHCNRGGGHSQSERAGSTSFSRSKKVEVGEWEAEAEDCAGKLGSGSTTPLERAKRGAIGTEMDDFSLEASFGENNLEFDGTGRGTRESTPCSFIRDLDSIGTPGSAVRSTCSGAVYQRQSRNSLQGNIPSRHEMDDFFANAAMYQRQSRNSFQRSIPSTHEMDDFFANAEMQHQKQFKEKYNFDVVNDLPLPGCYEWVRVDP